MGVHSIFTEELAREICDRLAIGENLRAICREDGMPGITTVMRWVQDNDVFREQYARAREAQAEYLVDEIIEIADDGKNDYMEKLNANGECVGWSENGEFANRSRLRVDARKWAASKMFPKKYGDKSQVEHTGKFGVDLSKVDDGDLTQLERILTIAAIANGSSERD